MDVDVSNFRQRLPEIIQAIAAAEFVALDLEMTGVKVDSSQLPQKPQSASPQAVYNGAREVAQTFQIVQLGITCVAYDEAKSGWP